MKRFFSLFLSALVLLSAVASCSDKNSDSSTDDSVNTTTAPTEPSTLPEPPQEAFAQTLTMAEGVYIYDNAKVLSQEDFSNCNNYAEWLYKNCLINVAVVTTDSIGDMTPAKYAETSYNDLYGNGGNGLLLLINNDTNEDYLYKTGTCSYQISQDDEASAFYTATAEIVNGDYKSAILRLLGLGEASQFVLDEAGVLSYDEINSLAQSCAELDFPVSLITVNNHSALSNADLCRDYFQRRFSDESGIIILLDVNSKSIEFQADSSHSVALQNSVANALSLASTGDYSGALSTIVNSLKGA